MAYPSAMYSGNMEAALRELQKYESFQRKQDLGCDGCQYKQILKFCSSERPYCEKGRQVGEACKHWRDKVPFKPV